MGGVPYKSTKEAVGVLSNVSKFNKEEQSLHVYSNLMPPKQII